MHAPSVAVGICACTEVQSTLRLVDDILSVPDEGFRMEQIVVVTPNREIASELENRDRRVEVVLEERREGKAAALNKAFARARGEIFVHASADIRLSESTIPALLKELKTDPECGAVVSHVKLTNKGGRLMDRMSVLLWSLFNNLNQELNDERRLAQAGDLYAFRRELVTEIPRGVINDDAYVALTIRSKGFRIKVARHALVWIGGPRTPVDYVHQRSRILKGHLQIVREQNKIPTTFEFTFASAPRKNMGILKRTIAELGSSYVPSLFVALPLEALSLGIAAVSSLLGRSSDVWRLAESTKEVSA